MLMSSFVNKVVSVCLVCQAIAEVRLGKQERGRFPRDFQDVPAEKVWKTQDVK